MLLQEKSGCLSSQLKTSAQLIFLKTAIIPCVQSVSCIIPNTEIIKKMCALKIEI